MGLFDPKCPICKKKGKPKDHQSCHRMALSGKRSRREVDEWKRWTEMRGMGERIPGAMTQDLKFYEAERRRR